MIYYCISEKNTIYCYEKKMHQSTKGGNYDRESYCVKQPTADKSRLYSALNLKIESWWKWILLAYITHYLSLLLVIWRALFSKEIQCLKVKSEHATLPQKKKSITSLLGKTTMSHSAIKYSMYFNRDLKLAEVFPWISAAALYKNLQAFYFKA